MTHVSDDTRVKLRIPDACRGISAGGEALPIGADGSLHTDPATAAALEAHGAVPWQDEPEAADLATLSRDGLVALFIARTRAALDEQDTETIRDSLAGCDDDPLPVTRDDVAQMNRAAVVCFLREHEIEMPANTSLADLRTRAVTTLAD